MTHIRSPQQYYVLGLGKSGLATLHYLTKTGNRPIIAWDDDAHIREFVAQAFPTVAVEAFAESTLSPQSLLVLSPGISHHGAHAHPAAISAREANIPITGDVEIFLQEQAHTSFNIGITGTNGKSTTTALIEHVLRENGLNALAGGNIGTPALSLMPAPVYVLELSSYQLDLIQTPALDVAILLNISPDHLEHHGSMAAYVTSKRHIFDLVRPDGIGIMGVDDPYTKALYDAHTGGTTLYGISTKGPVLNGCYIQDDHLYFAQAGKSRCLGNLSGLPSLKGEHNYQNIMAAFLVAHVKFHLSDAVFLKALTSFVGLPHRQEQLVPQGHITCVNDSKATNFDSALPALRSFKNIRWLVGGLSKTASIPEGLLDDVRPNISGAYCFGQDGALFQKILAPSMPTALYKTLDDAFHAALSDAKGDRNPTTILLSPAGASFDAFRNFSHRGEHFKNLWQATQLKDPTNGA